MLIALGTTSWAADFKAPVAKLDLKTGDTLVFLGDSITHQCLYTQYVEDFFYTRFPNTRIRFHNAGVGGAKAWDALERFERDVASYKPKYVTILLGMNDGRYQPYNEDIFRTYHKDMTEVVNRIKKAGAIPVLMTPTMYDSRAARMRMRRKPNSATEARLELYNSVLAYYGAWLREVAGKNGYGFVDMYSPLNNLTIQQRKTDPKFTLIRDAVHPGPSGQLVMAYAIINDMGLRGPVSNIRILNASGKSPKGQGRGGKISDLKRTDNGISFTFKANSLPWVLPEEAKTGVDILKLGHRASREGLEVHGLKPGQYELTIDGKHIGVFGATALERHIELQSNAKTPQYQQALAVAELNKKRNFGPVRALRGEWSQFQRFARVRAQFKERPGDVNLKKQFETLKKRIEGMEERVVMHEAAAKKIEDQIFAINKPKSHKYELKRVRMSQVSSVITLNGKPITDATIVLHGPSGVRAVGKTDEKGQVKFKTGSVPGVLAGTYKVTVSKREENKATKVAPGILPGRELIPAKYSETEKTVISVTIEPGENQLNFNLKF
ncbi:MAG: SGNH/GDSL hydrolase family protein [Planctomycetaceae bacterium]